MPEAVCPDAEQVTPPPAPDRPAAAFDAPLNPASLAASRVAGCARLAQVAVVAVPALWWAAVSVASGSVWHPGASMGLWALVALYAAAAFAAVQDFGAVARHRAEDAAAAANLVELGASLAAPRGADAQLNLGGRRVVVVVVGASDVGVRGRGVATSSSVRRGVSLPRLRAAARRAGADPAVLVAACDPRACAGHTGGEGVAVLCPSELTPVAHHS